MLPLVARLSSRVRWIIALVILSNPLLEAILNGLFVQFHHTSTHLDFLVLLYLSARWATTFALAFYTAGVKIEDLNLGFHLYTAPLALGWSIVLRICIIPFAILVVFLQPGSNPADQVLHMISPHQMKSHPCMALLLLMSISLMAGMCEELWRVGMLAGIRKLVPQLFNTNRGTVIIIFVIAFVFGTAHLYQGWAGMIITGVLGLVLGLIMVYRKSYWEAALAHAAFDASTFGLIFIIIAFPSLFNQPMIIAAGNGDLRTVELCLRLGSDINAHHDTTIPSDRLTALGEATKNQHLALMRFLLSRGASTKSTEGEPSPLNLAISAHYPSGVALLLKYKSDPNLRENELTPLMQAAQLGNLPIAKLLINGGADPSSLYHDPVTQKDVRAEDIARANHHEDVADFLHELKPPSTTSPSSPF